MRNDITILVNSCDQYEDLWNPFFRLFSVYWKECPYRIILNTESKTFHYDGLDIECFSFYQGRPDVPYGERILAHLKEIHTKYVLVLIDDFFFHREVKGASIEQCAQWMDSDPDIAAFYFSSLEDPHNIPSHQYPGYLLRPQVGEYKVNFQAALWRTEDFRQSWRKHESPWSWEKYATFRSFFIHKKYYVRQKETKNPIDYGAKYGEAWGVVDGRWVYDSVQPLFEKHHIHMDYSKRGLLTVSMAELPRDHQKKGGQYYVSKLKSVGIRRFLGEYLWRLKRKAVLLFTGHADEDDYYVHLYNKSMHKQKPETHV